MIQAFMLFLVFHNYYRLKPTAYLTRIKQKKWFKNGSSDKRWEIKVEFLWIRIQICFYELFIYFIFIIESYDQYQACFYRTDIFDLFLYFIGKRVRVSRMLLTNMYIQPVFMNILTIFILIFSRLKWVRNAFLIARKQQ